jgi:short-subunit dehydrogenase
LTRALAARGANLALVAFPGNDLDQLRQNVQNSAIKVVSLAYDLREADQREEVVNRVRKDLGPIDLLINNAGVEFTSPYHELSQANILDVLRVNLEAAMLMTWLVLPDLLARKRGHILSMSSLAGRANPALQEPYAATKAGLIAFTYSLRASYRVGGVSASVIVPGFVEAGIYEKLKSHSGLSAPALLGTSSPEKVVRAAFRAVERDLPEVIVNPLPVRPLLALLALFPSLGEWALAQTGGHKFFRDVFEATRQSSRHKREKGLELAATDRR